MSQEWPLLLTRFRLQSNRIKLRSHRTGDTDRPNSVGPSSSGRAFHGVPSAQVRYSRRLAFRCVEAFVCCWCWCCRYTKSAARRERQESCTRATEIRRTGRNRSVGTEFLCAHYVTSGDWLRAHAPARASNCKCDGEQRNVKIEVNYHHYWRRFSQTTRTRRSIRLARIPAPTLVLPQPTSSESRLVGSHPTSLQMAARLVH